MSFLAAEALLIGGLSVAMSIGCSSESNKQPNNEAPAKEVWLHGNRLLTIGEARAFFPGYIEVLEPAHPTAEERAYIASGRASLDRSKGIDRPVKLDSGELWLPKGFVYPTGCDGLYAGINLGDEAAMGREDARFRRCLVDTHLLDYSLAAHRQLVVDYLRVDLPESAFKPYDFSKPQVPGKDGYLGFEDDPAWHCGYLGCQIGTCVLQIGTNGQTTYGQQQCSCSWYHPVTCSSSQSDSWGVCYCQVQSMTCETCRTTATPCNGAISHGCGLGGG